MSRILTLLCVAATLAGVATLSTTASPRLNFTDGKGVHAALGPASPAANASFSRADASRTWRRA